jgi:hypothetical protein
MTRAALWAKTLKGMAKQPVKKTSFTDETPPAEMGEPWGRQLPLVNADLQPSVKAICFSPEIWKPLRLVRTATSHPGPNLQAIVDTLS